MLLRPTMVLVLAVGRSRRGAVLRVPVGGGGHDARVGGTVAEDITHAAALTRYVLRVSLDDIDEVTCARRVCMGDLGAI